MIGRCVRRIIVHDWPEAKKYLFLLIDRYVSRIIVHDWPEAKKYLFLCKTWLSANVGGGSLDRTFTTATHSQALSFHNLFMINSLR